MSRVPAVRVPRLAPGRWAVALALAAMLGGHGQRAFGQDAGAVFAGARVALLKEGVHRQGGFVFSSVRMRAAAGSQERAREAIERKAGIRAVRQMLAWRLAPQVADGMEPSGLRDAVIDCAVSCLDGAIDAAGLLTVHAESSDAGIAVVRSLPELRLESVSMDRPALIACLAGRSDRATPLEAFVLAELQGLAGAPADPGRDLVLAALSRAHGPGVALSLSGRWGDGSRRLCGPCLAGWTGPAASSVARTGACGPALAPLGAEALGGLSTDDLLSLLGTRINDPAVSGAIDARLRAAGFVRSADALRAAPRATVSFEDRPGSRLERPVRAAVLASPLVVVQLLSGGKADLAWGPAPACLAEATAAFDEATPSSVTRSIELLASGMGDVPNVDAMSLLSAALLASDEAALAEPIARAAFFAMPTHRFAGVNALRAAKALGSKERAMEIFPLAAAEGQYGNWARRQLEAVAGWLGVPVPPPPAPRGAAGEG